MNNTQGTMTASKVLDPIEERLLRMKEGQTVSDDEPIEQMGIGNAETMAKLREIELEAFMATNRVEKLRQEVGVTAEASDDNTKNKIISRLVDDGTTDSSQSSVNAEVTADATLNKES